VTDLVGPIRTACREIQPLSRSVTQLLALMGGGGQRSASQLAKVVATDPALTLALLRTANSAAFGLRQPVTSAAAAIAYLGDRLVLAVALNSAAGRVFERPLEGYAAEPGALWRHCLRTAIGARELAPHCVHPLDADTAFTAGILHDIGKSVLSRFLHPELREALEGAPVPSLGPEAANRPEVANYLALEAQAVGMDHSEVGDLLAEHWKLPPALRAAIRYHHGPLGAPPGERPLCWAVHLADALALMGGTITGSDGLAYLLAPEWKDEVRLGGHELERIMLKVEDDFEKAAAALAASAQETKP
jgi:putative nucleotidyltransferase with HDIG domain